jgi:hypothetical protein
MAVPGGKWMCHFSVAARGWSSPSIGFPTADVIAVRGEESVPSNPGPTTEIRILTHLLGKIQRRDLLLLYETPLLQSIHRTTIPTYDT